MPTLLNSTFIRVSSAVLGRFVLVFCLLLPLACDREKPPKPPAKAEPTLPTLRIYALAGAAGAVEPCGCVTDMLGGVDHAAAWIASQKKKAPEAIVVGAGPMFFSDPTLASGTEEQALFKAEAMALSLKDIGMVAWAPGANDWALGVPRFAELVKSSGATPLAANLQEEAGPVRSSSVVLVGGLKVALVGVSLPSYQGGQVSFSVSDAAAALRTAKKEAEAKGADMSIALIAAQRGMALRLIESVPGFQVAIVGKGYDQGDANDVSFSPEVVGGTLVAQATNHLQGLSVIDLFVRDGQLSFLDGSGLEAHSKRESLTHQIDELRARIETWSRKESGVSREDLSAQKNRLSALDSELRALKKPVRPQKGSYFLYDLIEIRESVGTHEGVASRLVAYYRKVNEHNKLAFADKLPRPVEKGQASYVGVAVCTACHQEARAVWDKTEHAGAYETLVSDHKEYNLDCVSCHVTGYEKPGGSTVSHVENLTSVQCEVCHGPGSLHVGAPKNKSFIRKTPARNFCASSCHHAPHVGDKWSADDAWPKILGKGHGLSQPLAKPQSPK